ATEHLAKNEFREAIPLMQEATRLAPDDFWARFALGVCYHQNMQDQQALGCYDACVALWPKFDRTHYNRGLIYLRMRDFKRAVADFDRFLKSQPEDVSGYLSRAQAEEGRQEYAKAEADLTRVIELNSDHTQAYLLRSRIKEKRGDQQGAKRDLEEGMRRTPSDELGWVGRGKHR